MGTFTGRWKGRLKIQVCFPQRTAQGGLWEPQTGTRVVRMSSTSPLEGTLCTPMRSQLNVCLRWHHWSTQKSTDTMCICNAKNNKKCNDVSFFKTIHIALLLSEEGGVKGSQET